MAGKLRCPAQGAGAAASSRVLVAHRRASGGGHITSGVSPRCVTAAPVARPVPPVQRCGRHSVAGGPEAAPHAAPQRPPVHRCVECWSIAKGSSLRSMLQVDAVVAERHSATSLDGSHRQGRAHCIRQGAGWSLYPQQILSVTDHVPGNHLSQCISCVCKVLTAAAR